MSLAFFRFYSITLLLWVLSAKVNGQNPVCMTDALMHRAYRDFDVRMEQLAQVAWDNQVRQGGGDAVIPVVVHVVWNTAAENIPDGIIQGFVTQIDEDFNLMNPNVGTVRPAFTSVLADVGIRFCLAQYDPLGNPTSGITRTYTTDTWFDPNNEPHKMKGPPDGISA